jgi:hypothetical protein
MGQAAALYSVTEARFQQLLVDLSFECATDVKESVVFDKTFQGLTYTLSKGQDLETVALMEHLFEPSTFLGPEIDWSEVNWEEERDLIVELEARIYYHSPVTVAAIARCLARVTAEDVLAAFDPEEMNQLGVYPCVWNRHQEPDDAFNEWEIVQEFQRLQQFFTRINTSNNYCLVYVG